MLSSSQGNLSFVFYGGAVSLLAAVAACNVFDGGTNNASVSVRGGANIVSYEGLADGDPTDDECAQFFAEFGTTPDAFAFGYDSDTGELSARITLLGGGDKRKGRDIFTWLYQKCFGSKKGDPSPGTGGSSGSTGGPGGNGSSGSSGQTGGPANPGGPGASGSTGAPGNECPEWNTDACRLLQLSREAIHLVCYDAPEENDFDYSDAAACEDGYRIIQRCLTQLARGGRGCGTRRLLLEVDSHLCKACMNRYEPRRHF